MGAEVEENPTHLIPIEEEIEGDIDGTSDFIFSRIGEPVPLLNPPSSSSSPFHLQNPPSQPLAVSEAHRLLFLAHSQGFLVARTKDVIRIAKDISDKGSGPNIQDSATVVDVKIGSVSILAVSWDQTTLAATVGERLHFFSVPSLLNKEEEPLFSCSLDGADDTVRDFKWQRNMEKSFIVLSSCGLLYRGFLETQLEDIMDSVDAVDWSVEGNFVAVARKNILRIFSSDFKEKVSMPLMFDSWSPDADSECTVKVDSIKWVRDDSIIIGSFQVNGDGNEERYLIQVITSREDKLSEISCKPIVFSFPDPFSGVEDDVLPNRSGPYLLASYLDCWELILASNQKAVDQHILSLKWSMDEESREVVILDFNSDKYTPKIGLQENGEDNLVLGFAVDRFSLYEKVHIVDGTESKELSPYCVLLCLTCEGKLIMYHVARISEPSVEPQTPFFLGDHDFVKKGLLTSSNPSEIEVPTMTSTLNDDVEGAALDTRLNPLSAEVPRTNKDTFEELGENVTSGRKQEDNSQLSYLTRQNVNSSKPSAGSCSAPRDDVSPSTQVLNKSSVERNVITTSPIGNIGSEAASSGQAIAKDIVKSGQAGNRVVGSTSISGASFCSQPTGKLFGADGFNAKSSAFASSRPILSDAQQKVKVNNFSSECQYDGQHFNSRVPVEDLPSMSYSSNKPTQNEGYIPSWTRTKNAESIPTIRGSPVSAQESFLSGKSNYSKAQPLLERLRASRSLQMSDSEPELSKQFSNVRDMAKELDTLLSFIEKEGGFRDVCTVFQKSSVLAMENGLQDLSEGSRICKKIVEERLMEIQQLKNKMLQVSARQVYMQGIVEQASDAKYWEIWNRQKLSPEFEVKRQHILDAHQDLTNQLIELGKHFNTLEINKFGESGKIPTGRRVSQGSLVSSRQNQPLHFVYNTLNSQLAAAEHLSECLSKQMSALNINPPSAKRQNIAKELLESIGLSHEISALQSPELKGHRFTPDSIGRTTPSTIGAMRKNTSTALKAFEPETARRRRDSLDRSWASFEPPKTTVKRIEQEGRFRVTADKPFRKAKEAFDSKLEAFAVQQISNATPAFSSSRDSLNEGIQQGFSKKAPQAQSNSLFKWAKDISNSSQTLESSSRPMQVNQSTTAYPSSSIAPSPTILSRAQSNSKGIFGSPDMSNTGISRLGTHSIPSIDKTNSNLNMVSNMQFGASTSSKKASTFLGTFPPMKTKPTESIVGQPGKNLNLNTRENAIDSSSAPPSIKPASLPPMSFGKPSLSTKPADVTTLVGSLSTSTSVTSSHSHFSSTQLSSQSQNSLFSATKSSTSLPPKTLGVSLPDNKHIEETKQAASVLASSATASSHSFLSSSTLQSSQSKSSLISASASLCEASQPPPRPDDVALRSTATPLVVPASEGSFHVDNTSSKPEPATPQASAGVVSVFGKEPSLTNSGSMFLASSNSRLETPSSVAPPLSHKTTEKDEGLDASSSQEDEMEEEAPDTTNVLNFGSLGAFGLGSMPPSSAPKPNPFGNSFLTVNSSTATSPLSLSASPGEPFRPASFSLPSAQPLQSPQPVNSGTFSGGFGGGFSGFGQPAQLGSGQEALGSVLGAFGQSRQIGGGTSGVSFASSGGFSAGGFSPASSSGGFATAATNVGGFAAAAKGGGFAAAATNSGGFAAAASGSGGFAAAAPAGVGFGGAISGAGFGSGGFSAFGSNQPSGFSAFSGNSAAGAGKPPAQLFTQMRK